MTSCFAGASSGSREAIFRLGPSPFPSLSNVKLAAEPPSRSVLLLSALEEEADLSPLNCESPAECAAAGSLNSERSLSDRADSDGETPRGSEVPSPVRRLRQADLSRPRASGTGGRSALTSSLLGENNPDTSLHGLSLRCKGTWPSCAGRRAQSANSAALKNKSDAVQPGAKLAALLRRTLSEREAEKLEQQTFSFGSRVIESQQKTLFKKAATGPPSVPRLDLSRLRSNSSTARNNTQHTRPLMQTKASFPTRSDLSHNRGAGSQQDSEEGGVAIASLENPQPVQGNAAGSAVRTEQNAGGGVSRSWAPSASSLAPFEMRGGGVKSAAFERRRETEGSGEEPRLSLQQRLSLLLQNARLERSLGARLIDAAKGRERAVGLHFPQKTLPLARRFIPAGLNSATSLPMREFQIKEEPANRSAVQLAEPLGQRLSVSKTAFSSEAPWNRAASNAPDTSMRDFQKDSLQSAACSESGELREPKEPPGMERFREMLRHRQRVLMQKVQMPFPFQSRRFDRNSGGAGTPPPSRFSSAAFEAASPGVFCASPFSEEESRHLFSAGFEVGKRPPTDCPCATSPLQAAVETLWKKFQAHKNRCDAAFCTSAPSTAAESRQQSAASLAEASMASMPSMPSMASMPSGISQVHAASERGEAGSLKIGGVFSGYFCGERCASLNCLHFAPCDFDLCFLLQTPPGSTGLLPRTWSVSRGRAALLELPCAEADAGKELTKIPLTRKEASSLAASALSGIRAAHPSIPPRRVD